MGKTRKDRSVHESFCVSRLIYFLSVRHWDCGTEWLPVHRKPMTWRCHRSFDTTNWRRTGFLDGHRSGALSLFAPCALRSTRLNCQPCHCDANVYFQHKSASHRNWRRSHFGSVENRTFPFDVFAVPVQYRTRVPSQNKHLTTHSQ